MSTPNLDCDFQLDVVDLPVGVTPITCEQEAWRNGKCVLHADTEEKAIDDVCEALAEEAPRIDAPKLQGLDFGNSFDFSEHTLYCADFSGANLESANFESATLRRADFTDAVLDHADFLDEADLSYAKFTDASLKDTRFVGSNLQNASLKHSIGLSIKCQNSKLMDADFTASKLSDGNFTGANLREATLCKVDLRGALCIGCNLERSDLSEADLRDSNLTLSKLHEADIRGIQADHRTNFGEEFGTEESEALKSVDEALRGIEQEDLEEGSIRGLEGKSWYEAFADRQAENRQNSEPLAPQRGRISSVKWATKRFVNRLSTKDALNHERLTTSTHVYRDYQRIFDENQLHGKRRRYHIRQKHAQRKLSLEDNDWISWLKLALARATFLHGESPRRVVESSALIVALFAVIYPIFGVQNSNGSIVRYVISPRFSWEAVYATISLSLSQFLNLSNAGYQALGVGRVFSSIEAVLGAIFVALFVFTLGRRATE